MKPSDPVFEALWKKVVDDWDNDEAHARFLEHSQTSDQLLEAAVRYRGMAGDRERGASAGKRLEAIALLAVARLESTRTPRDEHRRRAGRLLLILLFAAGSIALLLYGAR